MDNWKSRVLAATSIAARVDQDMWRRVKPLGHSRPVVRILSALDETPHITDRVLVEATGMTGPQLSRDILPLIEQGLVNTEASDIHKRQRRLSLTKAGTEAAKRIEQVRVTAFDEVMSHLTPTERSAITSMARRAQHDDLQSSRLWLRGARPTDVFKIFMTRAEAIGDRRLDLLESESGHLAAICRRWQNSDAHGFVIEDRGKLAGYALLMPGSFEQADADSETITMIGPHTFPDYHARGLDTLLLERCMADAVKVEADYLSVRVSTANKALIELVARNGFRKSVQSEMPDALNLKKRTYIFSRSLSTD